MFVIVHSRAKLYDRCSAEVVGVVTNNIKNGTKLIVWEDYQGRRVATPAEAFRNGADYIVMGRPIYKAPDVRAAVAEIAKSIEEGLSCRK